MNILVVRFSSMGDVICVTPLFSFLKKKYPSASITFVTDKAYSGLFADDPRLSQVIGIDKQQSSRAPVVSKGGWDLVVDVQNNARSRRMLAHTKGVAMVGSFDKLHVQRFILLFLRWSVYRPRQNVVTRYIRAAGGVVSIEELDDVRLFFSEEAKKNALAIVRGKTNGPVKPLIALFPFSAWKNKEWPLAGYAGVGRHFISRGWNVVIMGGKSDMGRANELRDMVGGPCLSLAGSLSLYECGSLLTGFSLAFGNDTGLSHLARASGVKTGIIFGPTTRHFGFYPYGGPAFKIFDVGVGRDPPIVCRPCHAHGGNICIRMTHACMRRITVDRVIAGLEELGAL
jgi:heptosyltransferase-2